MLIWLQSDMHRTPAVCLMAYSRRSWERCRHQCHPTRCCVFGVDSDVHLFFSFFFFFCHRRCFDSTLSQGEEACGETSSPGSLGITSVPLSWFFFFFSSSPGAHTNMLTSRPLCNRRKGLRLLVKGLVHAVDGRALLPVLERFSQVSQEQVLRQRRQRV